MENQSFGQNTVDVRCEESQGQTSRAVAPEMRKKKYHLNIKFAYVAF